jgi:hypothetical protein
MITIVFSRNNVFSEIGMVIKYSILDELPTVVTLIAMEPMNDIMTMKLKIVEPNSMLSIITAWMNSHPRRSDKKRTPPRIAIATAIAPT